MHRFILLLVVLFFVAGCANKKNAPVIDSRISPPEPDKDVREKYDAEQKSRIVTTCSFDNPDTSLSGIHLRDPQTAERVLKSGKMQGDTSYYFYSANKKEELGVTIHAGDYYSQVSIFHVKRVKGNPANPRFLSIEHFETEKGIRLGLSQSEIVSRLGDCYTTLYGDKKKITLVYRMESPHESRTGLLGRHNMPIYYGVYQLVNDRLVDFEFGFEYP